MSYLTDREKAILTALKAGKSLTAIAKEQKTTRPSISDSVARIRFKLLELTDDVELLLRLGVLRADKGTVHLVIRDPKSLAKMAR